MRRVRPLCSLLALPLPHDSDASIAARVRKAIDDHARETDAHANNVTRLVGSTAFRLRVGDFRVIFEESATQITVTKIAPRGNVDDD